MSDWWFWLNVSHLKTVDLVTRLPSFYTLLLSAIVWSTPTCIHSTLYVELLAGNLLLIGQNHNENVRMYSSTQWMKSVEQLLRVLNCDGLRHLWSLVGLQRLWYYVKSLTRNDDVMTVTTRSAGTAWTSAHGGPKKWHHFLYTLTLPNINCFSKLFHCQNQEKICNNTITKDPTTPQVCHYTTLWNVSVLKATVENKTSVTTHFRKVTTGNDVFIVSVIV